MRCQYLCIYVFVCNMYIYICIFFLLLTYQGCRGRRRNKGRHDAQHRSPLFARLAANSILYADTIFLKQANYFVSLRAVFIHVRKCKRIVESIDINYRNSLRILVTWIPRHLNDDLSVTYFLFDDKILYYYNFIGRIYRSKFILKEEEEEEEEKIQVTKMIASFRFFSTIPGPETIKSW